MTPWLTPIFWSANDVVRRLFLPDSSQLNVRRTLDAVDGFNANEGDL
jgi:hypothetical protein